MAIIFSFVFLVNWYNQRQREGVYDNFKIWLSCRHFQFVLTSWHVHYRLKIATGLRQWWHSIAEGWLFTTGESFIHGICEEAQTWQVSRLCRESHNFMTNLTLSQVDHWFPMCYPLLTSFPSSRFRISNFLPFGG